jgi:hypothetical protein
VVDAAVREYIENHRDEINAGVREALAQLDGTKDSAVSVLTGFDTAKLTQMGGMTEQPINGCYSTLNNDRIAVGDLYIAGLADSRVLACARRSALRPHFVTMPARRVRFSGIRPVYPPGVFAHQGVFA